MTHSNNIHVGQGDGVRVPIHTQHQSIGVIHSHPDLSPFSSADFSLFLLDTPQAHHRISVLSTIDEKMRVLIATDSTRRLKSKEEYVNWKSVAKKPFMQASKDPMVHDACVAAMAKAHSVGYYIGNASGMMTRFCL